MKKYFIIKTMLILTFFIYSNLYAYEKIYKISFPDEKNIEKGLLQRYYKILARYYGVLELKKEIKDFAYIAIDEIEYDGFDGKHNFSVKINTENYNDKNALFDDEIKEIFEIFLNEWKNLGDEDIKDILDEKIKKYEKDLVLIDLIKDYGLYTKQGKAFLKHRLNDIERKVYINLESNDIKTLLFLSYLNIKAGYGIKAEEILENASINNPNNFVLKNRYAILLKEMGKFDDAIKEFESQIETFKNPISYFYLGMTYKNKEECGNAIKILNQFIRLAKNNFEDERVVARNAIQDCEEGFRKSKKKKTNKRRNR